MTGWFPKLSKPVAIVVAVVALWLLARPAFFVVRLVVVVVLLIGTWWLLRIDLRAVFGTQGDARPWLVRLREHEWRPVTLPWGWRVSRSIAYLLTLLAWWWVL